MWTRFSRSKRRVSHVTWRAGKASFTQMIQLAQQVRYSCQQDRCQSWHIFVHLLPLVLPEGRRPLITTFHAQNGCLYSQTNVSTQTTENSQEVGERKSRKGRRNSRKKIPILNQRKPARSLMIPQMFIACRWMTAIKCLLSFPLPEWQERKVNCGPGFIAIGSCNGSGASWPVGLWTPRFVWLWCKCS